MFHGLDVTRWVIVFVICHMVAGDSGTDGRISYIRVIGRIQSLTKSVVVIGVIYERIWMLP